MIELIVGCLLAGLVVYFVAAVIATKGATETGNSDKLDERSELATVSQLIKRIGRAATTCTTTGTPPTILDCTGNFQGGVTSTYRFAIVNGALEQQKQVSGSWVMQNRYSTIVNFEVCGKAQLLANGATCPILPGFLSIPADAIRDDRFFRFRVTAKKEISSSDSANAVIQSAFYVRNPGDLGSSVSYQMGF